MMPTPEQFRLWFGVNYPEMNTAFHAPKIYRAAIAASPLPELLMAVKAMLQILETNANDDVALEAIEKIMKMVATADRHCAWEGHGDREAQS